MRRCEAAVDRALAFLLSDLARMVDRSGPSNGLREETDHAADRAQPVVRPQSRGGGGVLHRRVPGCPDHGDDPLPDRGPARLPEGVRGGRSVRGAVSYTHLTLPTKR